MLHELRLRLLIAYRVRGQLLFEFQRACPSACEYLAVLRSSHIPLAEAEVCIDLYLRWNEVMREMARAQIIPITPVEALAMLGADGDVWRPTPRSLRRSG